MKHDRFRTLSLLLVIAFATPALLHASVTISNTDFTYSQDFNSLPTANNETLVWTDNETLPGWYRRSNVSNAVQTDNPNLVDWSAQGSNIGDPRFYNASTAGTSDRAVGFLIDGGELTKGSVGVVFTNNTGLTITGFDLGYRGEQWYRYIDAVTTLNFEYAVVNSFATDINGDIDRVQPGTWTGVSALSWTVEADGNTTFTNGTTAGFSEVFAPVTLSGLSIADGQDLVIRWSIAETNEHQNGLFIDDVTFGNVTAIPEPSTYAVITGLLMFSFVMYRRKRAQHVA